MKTTAGTTAGTTAPTRSETADAIAVILYAAAGLVAVAFATILRVAGTFRKPIGLEQLRSAVTS